MTPPGDETDRDYDEVESVVERAADRHDATVVAARDVGSRAWNLADSDSDRDVMALFVQEPAAYATLGEYVETIDAEGDRVELHGWNVRRFAELLVESNPTAFEFLHSPLRYLAFDPLASLERSIGDAFEPIALYYHYRSLAERQYRKYLRRRLLEDGDLAYLIEAERSDDYLVRPAEGEANGDGGGGSSEMRRIEKGVYEEGRTDRTVKRNLYVARGVLYARYVRETHRFPDLDFPAFLEAEGGRFDPSFVARTRDLVERKRSGEGSRVVGRVFEPGEVSLPEIDPDRHAVGGVERERVDAFVRASLEEAAHRFE